MAFGRDKKDEEIPAEETRAQETPAEASSVEPPPDRTDAPVEEAAGDAPVEDAHAESATAEESRISVVNEPAPGGADQDDEYQWHTGRKRPTGREDAVEFVDVHKAFGRNRILRGLNMGIPEGMISMILGPSGTGKSVCIKHMVGLLYPDEGARSSAP